MNQDDSALSTGPIVSDNMANLYVISAESINTNILGTSAGPTHRQMEETIRGVIEATVIRENNPRCQLNVTIQPFNTNFCLTPLINCTILGPLLIRTSRTGPPGAVRQSHLLSGKPRW